VESQVKRQAIDSTRIIHDSVGCAMRTEGLNGAHNATYGQTENTDKAGRNNI